MEQISSLADLLDLQEVDVDIDRLLHKRETLPQLTAYRETAEELVGARAQLDALQSTLKETRLLLDKTTGELEISEHKLKTEQMRLYAGGLSARDSDYLRREVEMLTRQKEAMEDEVIELIEREEPLALEVTSASDLVAGLESDKGELETAISSEWKGIDAQIAIKEERKSTIVPLVEPDLFSLYEELRLTKKGVGVGRLGDGVCGGCHLRLTEAEQLEATRSNPPRCIHCRRILVA